MDSAAVGLLILLGVLAMLVAGIWQLASASARAAELRDRAAAMPGEGPMRRLLRRIDTRIRASRAGQRFVVQPLAAAGLDMPPHELLLIALGAGGAGYLVASLFFPLWLSIAVALAAVRGVWAWVELKRRRRREAFVAQLPELAQLLSNGASAGLSIAGALERSIDELGEPARAEVRLVLEQMRIGQSLELALERLRERMPSRELGVLVGTLVIQQRSGGDVVSALHGMADTLEQRKDLLREVRTLMAGPVFTAYVVALLGVGTVFLLNAISPGVLDRMLSSAAGIAVFVVAGILYAIGLLLVRQVTRVET